MLLAQFFSSHLLVTLNIIIKWLSDIKIIILVTIKIMTKKEQKLAWCNITRKVFAVTTLIAGPGGGTRRKIG